MYFSLLPGKINLKHFSKCLTKIKVIIILLLSSILLEENWNGMLIRQLQENKLHFQHIFRNIVN